MKLNQLGLFLLCVFMLSFSNCKKDESTEDKIAGSWIVYQFCDLDSDGLPVNCETNPSTPCLNAPADADDFIFNKDKSFRINFSNCDFYDNYVCTDYDEGTWVLNGDELVVTNRTSYDCDDDEIDQDLDIVLLTVVSVDGEELIVNDFSAGSTNANQITFKRQ